MTKKVRILSTKINKEHLTYMYWKRKLSIHKIARVFNVTPQAIRYWMIKYKIKRRRPNSIQKEKYRISKKLLENLYLKKKLSITEIAKKLGIRAVSTVHHKLIKYGIPIRTMSEAKTKYKKKSFSGNLNEKAYLLGLRVGDLYVHMNGLQIRISTGTTHRAQIEMLKKLFGKYSHLYIYPFTNKVGQKEIQVCCDLEKSFEFLLGKMKEIPNWVLDNDEYFFSFLGGYSDAEGSFDIFKNTDNTISFHFRIASNDKKILNQILNKLRSKGFSCKLYLHAKKGKKATYGTYSKNVYALRIFRKGDVLRLVNILKDKNYHEEKLKRMKLILNVRKETKWNRIKGRVLKLRKEIKGSRLQ